MNFLSPSLSFVFEKHYTELEGTFCSAYVYLAGKKGHGLYYEAGKAHSVIGKKKPRGFSKSNVSFFL